MQGTNPLTMQCTYSTPCGWCAKWDKKCDKKIGCDSAEPKISIKNYLIPESVISEIIEDVINYEKDFNNIPNKIAEAQMFTPWYLTKLRGEQVDDTVKITYEGESK